jgi:hypothetical protein
LTEFPSESVYLAYLNPVVDNSTEKFSWAVPNFVAVRDYAGDLGGVNVVMKIFGYFNPLSAKKLRFS